MTAFRYRAARADGERVTGRIEAVSEAAALRLVAEAGLFPVELHEAPREPAVTHAPGELAPVLAGLAALLEAGLPVDRALAAAVSTAPPRVAESLRVAQDRVREGWPLSAALTDTGVPELVLGALRAGERGGRLAAALEGAARDLESAAELRARVRTSLTYPLFLLVAGAASVAVIAGAVVPRFAALLGEQGRALPASTRFLLIASGLLGDYGLGLLVLAGATLAALAAWLRTEAGALRWAELLLELPVIGALRLRFGAARICAALAGLLDSGLPLLGALDLARWAAADVALARRLAAARLAVTHGGRLAPALARERALTATALRLVSFGEESGRLVPFLSHAARLEAAAAQRTLQRLVTLLEPLLILAFGAVVALVALALLQAVYSIRPVGA